MFNPLPKKLLVKPIDNETTVNGIVTTVKKQTKHTIGEVIAIGDKCDNIVIGDTVVFSKLGSAKYEEFLVVDYENVLGTIKQKGNK